jgi:hypothetical protein
MIRIACVGINLFAHAAVIKKLGLNLPLCVLGAGAIHALLLAAALPMIITLPNPAALMEPAETVDTSAVAIDTGPPLPDPGSLGVDVEIITPPKGELSAANAPVESAQGESVGAPAPAVSLDYAERVPIATPLPPRALEPLPAKPAEPPVATAAIEKADPAPTGSISDTNTTEAPAPSAGQMAAAPSPVIPAPPATDRLSGDDAAPAVAAEKEARTVPAPTPYEAKARKGVAGAAAVMAIADPTDVPAPKMVEVTDPGPPPPLPKRKPKFSKPVASVAPAAVQKKRAPAPKAAARPTQPRAVPRTRAAARPAPVAGRAATRVGPPTTGSWGQLLNAPNSEPIPKGKTYGTSR